MFRFRGVIQSLLKFMVRSYDIYYALCLFGKLFIHGILLFSSEIVD